MNRTFTLGALTISALFLGAHAAPSAGRARTALEFEELGMHLEVDLTGSGLPARSVLLGLPAEVVIACSSPRPLARLRVLDPALRTVLELDLRERGACGLAAVEIESEAATLRDALREYPQGSYLVEALAVDGATIAGRAVLSARFPPAIEVLAPAPGATVPFGDVRIEWTPSAGAARYAIEIEQEELGLELSFELGPGATSFDVPVQVLQPGRAYEYSLAVRGDTDNELEVEGGFVTAADGR